MRSYRQFWQMLVLHHLCTLHQRQFCLKSCFSVDIFHNLNYTQLCGLGTGAGWNEEPCGTMTLLMLQYVMNPAKMEECSQWKHWNRDRFCQELLSAVPDTSVVRPDSTATFVELISQLVLQFNLADPTVEDAFDQQLQAIDRKHLPQLDQPD
jgi:hypothetical protein